MPLLTTLFNRFSYSTFLVIIALFAFSTSCEVDIINPDPLSPPELNFPIFKMDVDDVEWRPDGQSIGGGLPFSIQYNSESGFISVSALSNLNDISNIDFSVDNIQEQTESKIDGLFMLDYSFDDTCIAFDSLSESFNSIFITELDEPNQSIKVNFEFQCYNECGDKHSITNGYAQLNYGF